MEFINLQMVTYMKENTKMIKEMAKEFLFMLMVIEKLVNIQKVSHLENIKYIEEDKVVHSKLIITIQAN